MTTEYPRYTILGTTDEHTACDCCGRSDLKDTVAMHDKETGKDVYFGCVCAGKMLGVKSTVIAKDAAKADKKKADIARYTAELDHCMRLANDESYIASFKETLITREQFKRNLLAGAELARKNLAALGVYR